jgi:hypothetical protein
MPTPLRTGQAFRFPISLGKAWRLHIARTRAEDDSRRVRFAHGFHLFDNPQHAGLAAPVRPARHRSPVMRNAIDSSSWQRSRSTTIALAVLGCTVLAARSEAQIPAPWTYADVGSVGIGGSATYSSANDVLTVKAAGADIWGTADSFGYLYQPFVGDGYAIVRVSSLQNTSTFAKAAIMLRESLDPGSPEVILDLRPTGDIEFMTRPSAGAATTFVAGASTGFPQSIYLFRDGSVLTAYANGTAIGSTTISMGPQLLVGVAVTSHDVNTLTTATFGLPLVHNYSPQPFPNQFMINVDVGAVGTSGAATYTNGTYTVSGAGADIWGTADAFHFVGLGVQDQLVARVTAVGNTDPFAKAGIDMRLGHGAAPSDSHVILDVRPTGDIEFMVRPKDGAETVYLAGTVHQLPVWLELAVSGATISGYVSSDGLDWTLVGTAEPDFAGMNAGDGRISSGLVVTSHDPSVLNTSTFDNVAFIRNFNGLPDPWRNGDVGDTGAAGSTSWAAGTFTLKGSGADIWGTTDAFQFLFQGLGGCCSVTGEYPLEHVEVSARVTSVQNTDAFAKAGVMLRTSSTKSFPAEFDPSAADVILDVRPTGDVEFMTRSSKGAETTYVSGTTATLPVWLKLTRVDDLVTGYVSSDGDDWTAVGTTRTGVSIDDEQAGIVVTSHVRGTLNTATFDHVELRIPR